MHPPASRAPPVDPADAAAVGEVWSVAWENGASATVLLTALPEEDPGLVRAIPLLPSFWRGSIDDVVVPLNLDRDPFHWAPLWLDLPMAREALILRLGTVNETLIRAIRLALLDRALGSGRPWSHKTAVELPGGQRAGRWELEIDGVAHVLGAGTFAVDESVRGLRDRVRMGHAWLVQSAEWSRTARAATEGAEVQAPSVLAQGTSFDVRSYPHLARRGPSFATAVAQWRVARRETAAVFRSGV